MIYLLTFIKKHFQAYSLIQKGKIIGIGYVSWSHDLNRIIGQWLRLANISNFVCPAKMRMIHASGVINQLLSNLIPGITWVKSWRSNWRHQDYGNGGDPCPNWVQKVLSGVLVLFLTYLENVWELYYESNQIHSHPQKMGGNKINSREINNMT